MKPYETADSSTRAQQPKQQQSEPEYHAICGLEAAVAIHCKNLLIPRGKAD